MLLGASSALMKGPQHELGRTSKKKRQVTTVLLISYRGSKQKSKKEGTIEIKGRVAQMLVAS